MKPFRVQILGSNSAIPIHGRHPSAQLIYLEPSIYLIDCGEGTQIRMDEFRVKKMKIDKIFISHIHGDHSFGLPGLLTSYNLLGRTSPLTIYGPKDLEEMIMGLLKFTGVEFDFTIEFVRIECEQPTVIYQDEDVSVSAFPLDHRDDTYGFIFRERRNRIKLDNAVLERYRVPDEARAAISYGEDYVMEDGKVIENRVFSLEKQPVLRSYAYCSDTAYDERIAEWVRGVDVLYHETTYLSDFQEQATERKHSTTRDAAEIAGMAGVGRLLIGHFSSRYRELGPFLVEARGLFEQTDLAEEGMTFEIIPRVNK